MWRGIGASVVLTLLVTAAPPAGAATFSPKPRSRAAYAMPSAPVVHRVPVDGGSIHTETYLPQRAGDARPPRRLPTVLIMTPYETALSAIDRSASSALRLDIDHFVPRGYAVTVAHVYGTGKSDGCLDLYGRREVDATARVVQYLGEQADWTNGRVGMYGLSYPGETQIGVAALGDPKLVRSLKAIVPVAAATGFYDSYAAVDGVPFAATDTQNFLAYHVLTNPPAGEPPRSERVPCVATQVATSGRRTGDFTAYDAEREYRQGAGDIRAAVLLARGLLDTTVHPLADAGFLDRLDPTTPLAAVIGQWGHVFPDEAGRGDWLDMVTAWYDQWLKGHDTGVRRWPRVQVQDTAGRWRAERNWPRPAITERRLRLGQGETEVSDSLPVQAPGAARFDLAPTEESLHISGQPELELWLRTDKPDAHVGVRLEVLDGSGRRVGAAQLSGMRSLQHLDPLVDGRFEQSLPKPAPVGTPIRVPVRLVPLDVTVPAGGRLRVTVAGTTDWDVSGVPQNGMPSGAGATLTILSERSALRFTTPGAGERRLVLRRRRGR